MAPHTRWKSSAVFISVVCQLLPVSARLVVQSPCCRGQDDTINQHAAKVVVAEDQSTKEKKDALCELTTWRRKSQHEEYHALH